MFPCLTIKSNKKAAFNGLRLNSGPNKKECALGQEYSYAYKFLQRISKR